MVKAEKTEKVDAHRRESHFDQLTGILKKSQTFGRDMERRTYQSRRPAMQEKGLWGGKPFTAAGRKARRGSTVRLTGA